ncbi:hypothetical protein B7P43_G17802 [Cryptotermes secundus]|uniref:Uncharacterized protein n=1 Tax=Cryptotermes secundus TaxID=105785 RepID=A0A2J7PTB4_9NEOP|nr:hypothetical protein B7P43_G17802 [Cryptotermes secundus]
MKQKKEGLLRRLFSWFMILITSTKTVDASNDGVPPRNEQDGSSTQVTQCDAEETPECVPSMRITSPTCSMSESPKQVSASVESVEKLIHDLDHFSKELMVSISTVQSKISGSDKKVVALVQVFPEYFGFPCQSSFHQLLHNHPRLSSGAGTTGQKWPQYKELSPTPLAKKKVPLPSQTP